MTAPSLESTHLQSMDPDDAAAHWLVLRDRGFAPSEAGRFAAWLSASDANAEAWRRAEGLWTSFDAEPDVLLDSMRKAALAARPSREQSFQRGLIAASAAAMIVMASLIGWRGLATMRAEAPGARSAMALAEPRPDHVTQVGVRSDFSLPDGTRVTLDSDSALAVAYTAARRDVHLLRGQAFFAVKHDAIHPFTVNAAGRTVTALGTAFDVHLDRQSLSVVLAKGSVLVAQAGGSAVRLSPGQRFQAGAGQPGVVSTVDVDQMLAWRTGYLEFRDEPLTDAVAEMNRYGGEPVSIGDPAISSLRISGRFRIGDPARFARTLTEVYPLRARARPRGGLTLVRRGGERP